MQKVVVHYGEIGLKGQNKSFFENKLVSNIKKSAQFQQITLHSIHKKRQRIFCEFDASKDQIITCLSSVLGIKNFLLVDEFERDIEVLKKETKYHI